MILKPRNLLVRTVFVLTELVESGTQCKMFKIQTKCGNIHTEQEIERLWWRIKLSSRYCIPRLAENYRRKKGHFRSCQRKGNKRPLELSTESVSFMVRLTVLLIFALRNLAPSTKRRKTTHCVPGNLLY